ncbi:exonuclease domain-containing protein [Corynebacterium sp. HMSC077D03]|uniref:exonuclease domain-containing protein n=1 Tax=Corynebacterium sp. HMSC077D03 TaxID=1739392 RepID=UPI0008A286B5|nr:exonuclease domain-containing protein [Corynebacterium sp. HMSC077D03]OFR37360.1 exonuclease [Corynebacterium sp. HMSC077D03]
MVAPKRYAVVDFETTGFGSTDRVIEIGVVLLDHNRDVESTWETLVQPQRDIPNSFVHRITPTDVVDAPLFGEVAGEFFELLNGRTVVAHNAPFEARFLKREFSSLGVAWPNYGAWVVDTKRLFQQTYPGEGATLEHALEVVGITNARPHSALADALATAELFARLVSQGTDVVISSRAITLPPQEFPARGALLPRTALAEDLTHKRGEWLVRLADTAAPEGSGDAEKYKKLLAAALVDKELSKSEIVQLQNQAQQEGLTSNDVMSIHEEFIRQLAVEVWLDGEVTEEERATLLLLNEQLGLPADTAEALLAAPQRGENELGISLSAGDRVTFTGQFDLPREEWERRAMAVGLSVGGVTKKSVLLVAANPDSMSGKARKAREYGVPIIGETAFARLLGNMSGGGQLVEQDLSAQPAELELTETYGIFPWSTGVSGTSAHTGTKALAVEWCAKHPRRKLLELSPQLTPFSEIEVQSSYKSGYTQWFARFPQPLEATVEDLRDLPGVGEHKLVAMVEAVVLAASDSGNAAVIDSIGAAENLYGDIPLGNNPFSDDDSAGRAAEFLCRTSEEIRALDQAALYIGWAQLNGAVVEVASLPSAVAAEVPIITAHLEHQSPVRALFQRAVDELDRAIDGDERKRGIVCSRWLGGATLDSIGTAFGLTRERIRQLERQLAEDFEKDSALFKEVVAAVGKRARPILPVDELRRELPDLVRKPAGFDATFGEIFTGIGKQWEVVNGWLVFNGFTQALSERLTTLADDHGIVRIDELAVGLEVTPERLEQYIVTNDELKVAVLDNYVLTKVGSYQDRAVSVLAINGEPMTAEAIMDTLGGGSPRSASNQFSIDPRLTKVSADQWALTEWGHEEFKSIASWISTRLAASTRTHTVVDAAGSSQEVPAIALNELLAQAERLRISELSIRQYAANGDFETRDGMVIARVDESGNVMEGDIADARDAYLRDGEWNLLLTVNKDHLRGSGFAVPAPIAAYYGVKVGESCALSSRLGEEFVRVNRLKQVSLSTIKRFLDELGVREGQRVWLKLGKERTFDVSIAPAVQHHEAGLARLYDFVGLDGTLMQPGESTEDSLARVNEILGLSPQAPRRRTVAVFRHRHQDEIADLIQEL